MVRRIRKLADGFERALSTPDMDRLLVAFALLIATAAVWGCVLEFTA